MKKIIIKSTGKEVKLGDTIRFTKTKEFENNKMYSLFEYYLSPEIIDTLVAEGILEVVDTKDTQIELTEFMNDIFVRISKKLNWNINRTINYLNKLSFINASALFNVLVKEIAVKLDEKYPDHIKNSEKIFVISNIDGRISEVNKATIKNYRNFAAFRNIEDAKDACKALKLILKNMFTEDVRKQKD